MGIDIAMWRARIGCFSVKGRSLSVFWSILLLLIVAISVMWRARIGFFSNKGRLVSVLLHLSILAIDLCISNDFKSNNRKMFVKKGEFSSRIDILRLNSDENCLKKFATVGIVCFRLCFNICFAMFFFLFDLTIVARNLLLLSGDVESNPGPNPTIFNDCFLNKYYRIPIKGDGLCGYRSLSYCLTGDQDRFKDIVNNCLVLFHNYPNLYSERVDAASQYDVSAYEIVMCNAVSCIELGEALNDQMREDVMCQDGHYVAISVIYDICIFLYDTVMLRWNVYNEEGKRGYICLINHHQHTEVLEGIGSGFQNASIPLSCYKEGLTKREFVLSELIPFSVAEQISTSRINSWPISGVPEVHFVSESIFLFGNQNVKCQNESFGQSSKSYIDDYQFNESGLKSWPNSIPEVNIFNETAVMPCSQKATADVAKSAKAAPNLQVLSCQLKHCNYRSSCPEALKMHMLNTHKVEGDGRLSNLQKTKFYCSIENCNYVAKTNKALSIHNINKHSFAKRNNEDFSSKKELNNSTAQGNLEESEHNDKESMLIDGLQHSAARKEAIVLDGHLLSTMSRDRSSTAQHFSRCDSVTSGFSDSQDEITLGSSVSSLPNSDSEQTVTQSVSQSVRLSISQSVSLNEEKQQCQSCSNARIVKADEIEGYLMSKMSRLGSGIVRNDSKCESVTSCLSDSQDESSFSSAVSSLQNSDSEMSIHSLNYNERKQQCLDCLEFFVCLAKHKKCTQKRKSMWKTQEVFDFDDDDKIDHESIFKMPRRSSRLRERRSTNAINDNRFDVLRSCSKSNKSMLDSQNSSPDSIAHSCIDDFNSAANKSRTSKLKKRQNGKEISKMLSGNSHHSTVGNVGKCNSISSFNDSQDECNLQSAESSLENSYSNNSNDLVSLNKGKQQCLDCLGWFVCLGKHTKCTKKQLNNLSQKMPRRNKIVKTRKQAKFSNLLSESKDKDLHCVAPVCKIDNNVENRGCDAPKVYACEDNVNAINAKQLQEQLKNMRKRNKKINSKKVPILDDALHKKLIDYHGKLSTSVDNIVIEKHSAEVLELVKDANVMSNEKRPTTWSTEDNTRYVALKTQSKTLTEPAQWSWSQNSPNNAWNNERMAFCVQKEMTWNLVRCSECKSTGVNVGIDQIGSNVCYDCAKPNQNLSQQQKDKLSQAWEKVRPQSPAYPKRTEKGHENENLPPLTPGDKAVIAPVHPAVTIKKNSYNNKKYRQEHITLIQNNSENIAKILPRTDLKERFVVIERTSKDGSNKYITANVDNVRIWLRYLSKNHPGFIEMIKTNQLKLSEEAFEILENEDELAEVDSSCTEEELKEIKYFESKQRISGSDGLEQASLQSGFSENHVVSFDRLYLKPKELLRIKREGKIEIIKDRTIRKPAYNISATLTFPHLYPNGELSPLDQGNHTISKQLLKKQTLFAHEMADGRLQWTYSDPIHMASQYAHVCEQEVRDKVSYYISQHPEVAHLPMETVIKAFQAGYDGEGLIDTKLPNLTSILAQTSNSREQWFSRSLELDSISCDLGDANTFLTLNMDPRAWPDVRQFLYKLEYGCDMPVNHPFEKDTAAFTKLMEKYAPQLSIYLSRKAKIFLEAFFCDICGIPKKEIGDWTEQDSMERGWYWFRVEFTETRGVPHFHCIARLPNVLPTALLGRMVQNMRVVRREMRCGNIKAEKLEHAWEIIECGLLAHQYIVLLADSLSASSFYKHQTREDGELKEILKLETFRDEFVSNYVEGNIDRTTHPIMRRFDDAECDDNEDVELAKVAAVSCMHQCLPNSCSGDPATGVGCRFDFPKPNLPITNIAIFQVNAEHMEARVLLERTCDRVPSISPLLLKYWRANIDCQILISASHIKRYVSKYVSKNTKHYEMLNECVEHLVSRKADLIPPNTKQALTSLILADCSHRAFISIQELAYKIMGMAQVFQSFSPVEVIGFYNRARLEQSYTDKNTFIYNDRTELAAYAERCLINPNNLKNLTKDEIEAMTYLEFCETVRHVWVKNTESNVTAIDPDASIAIETCDSKSGHWKLVKRQKRKHIRVSTVLNTPPASEYELVDTDSTTTQTLYFELEFKKRRHLYRSYYELIMYVPWNRTPEESFLSKETQELLKDSQYDPEAGYRYSLKRLEAFYEVYMTKFNAGEVAKPGTRWQRDNQLSYTMYLANLHNSDVRLERSANDGRLNAQFEPCEEMEDTEIQIRPDIQDESDNTEFPSALSFMPPDMFREVLEQPVPDLSEINVAFPLQRNWQLLEEVVMIDKEKLFMAKPPPPAVNYTDLTFIQQRAVDLVIKDKLPVVYLCGRAGCGKTTVALVICEMMKGRVQAGSSTGKAASNFHGPTLHGMFGWSHNDLSAKGTNLQKEDSIKIQNLRVFYQGIELFVIDEADAMSASDLGLLHEFLTLIFNPTHKKGPDGHDLPFGGIQIVLMGDPAQLRPVFGAAIYDDKVAHVSMTRGYMNSLHAKRTKMGQELYKRYMLKNCVYFEKGQRNRGLLSEIADRIRLGTQTIEDLNKLTFLRKRFPEVEADYGIRYDNDSCSVNNLRHLWNDCQTTQKRMYICKASYLTTENNYLVVDGLTALPAKLYSYAPHLLCVAEGCEVRLIQNINTAAGLVNSATGTVVKVIYNNADVKDIRIGNHPAPYCIVVDFPGFNGVLDKNDASKNRKPLFPNHPTWVPIYRKKFSILGKDLPGWIRKKQFPSDCYRMQFPLDLSSYITCHRAQGQTLRNCLISVDLGLESPDAHLPIDVASIAYVSLTRVNDLKSLLVSNIYPDTWMKIGQSSLDIERREVEKKVKKAALDFASGHGYYKELKAELENKLDSSGHVQEWLNIQQQEGEPQKGKVIFPVPNNRSDYEVQFNDLHFQAFLKPVLSERHIGLDQGTRHFGIAVVDKMGDGIPMIVSAEDYSLDLAQRPIAGEVLLALSAKTDLLPWMKQTNISETVECVDRVIVHVEQIALANKNSKALGIELCKLLQQRVDAEKCIVKLSQPNLHRSSGPAFKLGKTIVEKLALQPVSYTKSKPTPNPALSRKRTADTLEGSQDEESEGSDNEQNVSVGADYRKRKRMSADVFRYIIQSDEARLANMKLAIAPDVQQLWRDRLSESNNKVKLDDVGDALLHALNEVLCGTSNFKQVTPMVSSLHDNRTISITVLPSTVNWAVLHCTWNTFTIEHFGSYDSALENATFKSLETTRHIESNLHEDLSIALLEMDGGDLYEKVNHIKVVVKQLTAHTDSSINRLQAGALSNSTVTVMKRICDKVMKNSSLVVGKSDKVNACMYVRANSESGQRFSVTRSAGKHTNAILSCVDWFKQHLPDFVAQRRQTMTDREKLIFFQGLVDTASSNHIRLEMLKIADRAKRKLFSHFSICEKKHFADLILIAINKNQQYVKAVAANCSRSELP